MQFRILGSLSVVGNGRVAELGPPKQRALLAILLTRIGEVVPVERLIELLWGAAAPRTAEHSIQIYVSDLRHALEPLGGSDVLVTRQPGYLLEVDPDSVDAWRFERLVKEGTRLLEDAVEVDELPYGGADLLAREADDLLPVLPVDLGAEPGHDHVRVRVDHH